MRTGDNMEKLNGRERTQVRKREEEEKKRGIQRGRDKYAKEELNGIYISSITQICINQ